MRYPYDVYSKAKRGKKMTDSDKGKLVLGVLLVINVILFVVLMGFFRSAGVPLFIPIIVQVVLFIIMGIMIYRFFIFREQDRDINESDVFMQYYGFRPGNKARNLPTGKYFIADLKNNSYVSAVQLKFGSNDATRKKGTEMFLSKILAIAYEKKIKVRIIVMDEKFLNTSEADAHLEKVNRVKHKKLRNTLLNMYSSTFRFVEDNCTNESIVFMFYAANSYMCDELEDIIVQFEALFNKLSKTHAFRRRDYLDHTGLLGIFKQFYGMSAVDLSLSKVQLNRENNDMLKSISLYRIVSEEGRTFTNPVFEKIKTGVRVIK